MNHSIIAMHNHSNLTPTQVEIVKDIASLAIAGLANATRIFLEAAAKSNEAETAYVLGHRANALRQAIMRGKRMRYDEMTDLLSVHQVHRADGTWTDITRQEIADYICLPIETVTKATKRFWFF